MNIDYIHTHFILWNSVKNHRAYPLLKMLIACHFTEEVTLSHRSKLRETLTFYRILPYYV